MAYTDRWATCAKCGKQFVFRVEEQREQVRQGKEITPPELCPDCRPGGRVEQRAEPRRDPRPRPGAEPPRRAARAELGPGPHEGVVKWFEREKGYGFIIHPSGEELFFHRSSIAEGETPDFPDGTRVTYCVEQTAKGPEAVDVARMQ